MAIASRINSQLRFNEPAGLRAASLTIAIGCLNVLDALLTLLFLELKLAEEANPLMRFIYSGSPLGFLVIKLSVVQLGLLILCSNYRVRLARYALVTGAVAYAAVALYHLAFLAHLALGRGL